VRYFSPLIAKVTTAEGHHQELFGEKKEKGLTKVLEFLAMVKILKKRLG